MATISAAGKRLGRPPKAVAPAAPAPAAPAVSLQDLAVARAVKTFMNRYDAAGKGRRMAGWNPPSTGPNVSLQGIQTIRNRAADVRRNDWSGESVNQKWSTALVGIGITPRFKRIKSADRRQEIVDLFSDFAKDIDADGVLDYFGQQTLVVETWVGGGECFARRRNRFPDEYKVPMQVQLLEPEMVPVDLNVDTFDGLPSGNRIRMGIELNKRGKRVAYWVYKSHPGDAVGVATEYGADQFVRVAASEMTHIYKPARVGALRGVSMLAPVLARLRSIGDYQDTVLERQKLANMFVGFIHRTLPTLDPSNPLTGALTGMAAELSEVGEPLMALRPGLIQELEDGQSIEFPNVPEAGTTYSDYIRTEQLGTAAGTGLPYEIFSGDIKDISDRTLRVIMNEFRRLASQRQWQIVIPMFCQVVIDWFADSAYIAGHITLAEVDFVRRVEHAPHGWEHIHPVQDPQGKLLEITGGLRSRSSVIGERGDDRDTVDQEREDDAKSEKTHGLLPDPVEPAAAPAAGGNGGKKKPPAASLLDSDDEQDRRDEQERLATQQLIDGMRNLTQATTARNNEPTTVEVHAHIAAPVVNPTPITVNNEISPTPITVNNEISPTPITVNNEVHPPTVNVEPATVVVHNEVQPADVNVHLPDRKTTSVIKRNGQGDIIDVTQTETDA